MEGHGALGTKHQIDVKNKFAIKFVVSKIVLAQSMSKLVHVKICQKSFFNHYLDPFPKAFLTKLKYTT